MKKYLLCFRSLLVGMIVLTSALHGCEEDVPKDEVPLEVEPKPAQIIPNIPVVTLRVGETMQITYAIIPDTVEITDMVWSSADAAIASVSQEGLITAHTIGGTTVAIRSEREDADTTVVVTVIPTILEEVYLEADVIPVYINQPKTLSLVFEPADATDKTISWESSDNNILTIDGNGIATAHKTGYAWISASQGTLAYDHAVLVPASEGQIIAASQVNISTGEQKHYIMVYVAGLAQQAVINEVKLYLGIKGDPNATELKTVRPALSLDPGKGGEISIEVNADEANELTFGRYLRIDVSSGGSNYYVYVSWMNNITTEEK
jgi:hypothetical protein